MIGPWTLSYKEKLVIKYVKDLNNSSICWIWSHWWWLRYLYTPQPPTPVCTNPLRRSYLNLCHPQEQKNKDHKSLAFCWHLKQSPFLLRRRGGERVNFLLFLLQNLLIFWWKLKNKNELKHKIILLRLVKNLRNSLFFLYYIW